MRFEAIKLEFTSPLHIGRGWGDLDRSEPILHSDSLKSAIYFSLIQLFPEWKSEEKALEFFNGFVISSCFPYYNNEFFLPKLPIRNFIISGIDDYKIAKVAKKIEYLSLDVFKNYLNSKEIINIDKKQLSENGKYVFANNNAPINFIRSQTQQRITIKNTGKSIPFFVDRLFFMKNSGLYFLADFKKNDQLKFLVFKALKFLGTIGIGTDKTVGNGFFEFDENRHVQEILIETKNTYTNDYAYASLGLFIPTEEEFKRINFDKSFWNIKERGGYIAGSEYIKFRHLLKKSIYMFTEGSIFFTETLKENLEGKLVNLKPDWNDNDMHNVYRCGKSIFIKVNL